MKCFVLFIVFSLTSFFIRAQSIEGNWETYDDNTGKKRSVVSIYKKGEKLYGKVIEKFEGTPADLCDKCEGSKHDKPIIGLEIIEGLKLKGTQYSGGTITDPETGNVYKCYLELLEENKLKVRGFIGFAIIGRTQYWKRANF